MRPELAQWNVRLRRRSTSPPRTLPTKDNLLQSDQLRGLKEAVREEAEADGGQHRLLEDVVRGKPVGNNGPVLGGGQVPR